MTGIFMMFLGAGQCLEANAEENAGINRIAQMLASNQTPKCKCISSTVSEEHEQQGHVGFNPECEVCVKTTMRKKKHERKKTYKVGTIAVDLVALGQRYIVYTQYN